MPETTQQIPAIIREKLEEIEKLRRMVLDMVPLVSLAEELIEKFRTLPGTSDWRLSVGYGPGQLNGVLVHVDALDFRELTVIRRWLREHGLPAPETEDYAEIGRRSWTYCVKDKPNFVFSGFIANRWDKTLKGQKCQFVKVGMKEPEPLYELRCDGAKLEEVDT